MHEQTFFKIKYVDVQKEYKEYLLRIPVLLNKDKVLDEGIFSKITILKNLIS